MFCHHKHTLTIQYHLWTNYDALVQSHCVNNSWSSQVPNEVRCRNNIDQKNIRQGRKPEDEHNTDNNPSRFKIHKDSQIMEERGGKVTTQQIPHNNQALPHTSIVTIREQSIMAHYRRQHVGNR